MAHVLAVDYYRPTKSGELHQEPLPVIWSHTRYQRANITAGKLYTGLDYHPPLISVLQHGYVIATADVRGAGASFGTKYGWFPPEEAADAYDITEWFAARDWCNSRVGMARRSYLGITQYFNAAEAPPHLACIFPEVAWIDEYDLVYPGGIFSDWGVYCWSRDVESADRSAALPEDWRRVVDENRDRHATPAPYVELAYTGVAPAGGDPGGPVVPVDEDSDATLLAQATAEHRSSPAPHRMVEGLPFRDSVDAELGVRFHEQRSLYPCLGAIERSGVPSYHLGGWLDGFARDTMLWFRNYPNRQKLVMGPWFHGGAGRYRYAGRVPSLVRSLDERYRQQRSWRSSHALLDDECAGRQPSGGRPTSGRCPKGCGPAFTFIPVQPKQWFRSTTADSLKSYPTAMVTTSTPLTTRHRPGSTTAGPGPWVAGSRPKVPKPPHFYPYPDMQENDRKGLTFTTEPLDQPLEVTGSSGGASLGRIDGRGRGLFCLSGRYRSWMDARFMSLKVSSARHTVA